MITATATLTRTFGIVAPTLTILQCVAQANRIRTTGAKGVSLGTWILSAFVGEIWFCYGIIFHVTAELFANVPAIAVSLVVALLAAKSQEKMPRSIVGLLTVTLITVLAAFVGSFHDLRWVLASVAVGSSIIIYLPQLALVIRPKDLSGVSILSWCLACLTSLGWLVYGFLIHQPALAVPSFVMLPSAFIIFVQASRHRIMNNSRTGLQAPIVE